MTRAPSLEPLRRPLFVGGFTALLMACVALRKYLQAMPGGWEGVRRALYPAILYNRTVITPDYLHLGFVRRGLGGTIARLLSPDFIDSAAFFDFVSIALLVSALGLLVVRVTRTSGVSAGLYLGVVAAIAPQTFEGWSRDPGRTDVLTLGLLAWATIATLHRYRALGVLLVLVASLAHETAIVFGAPLLFVLNARAVHDGQLGRKPALGLLAFLLGGFAILTLAQIRLSPPPSVIADYMFRASPHAADPAEAFTRDNAIYMMVSGLRGIRTSVCWNLEWDPRYTINILFALAVLCAYLFILDLRPRLFSFALAAVLPLLAMVLIADDTGRWLKMAVLNAWLLAAFARSTASAAVPWDRRAFALNAVLLALLLAMGSTSDMSISNGAERLATAAGLKKPGPFEAWMAHCDPAWRSVLHGAQKPAAGKAPL